MNRTKPPRHAVPDLPTPAEPWIAADALLAVLAMLAGFAAMLWLIVLPVVLRLPEWLQRMGL